jgi:hypothetical protein
MAVPVCAWQGHALFHTAVQKKLADAVARADSTPGTDAAEGTGKVGCCLCCVGHGAISCR